MGEMEGRRRSNFGTNIDDGRTTIWGLGAQDAATFGQFTVTGGLRYDHNSAYGDAWSPRGTVSWLSADGLWKLRASGGTGFRAPTVGELFYPFSGNPDLQPETSVSGELGAERYIGAGRAEVSLFWTDLKDLIVYDFATQTNLNIGKARTRGVEVGWRQPVSPSLSADATYTYLDAQNLVTGRAAPSPPAQQREPRRGLAADRRARRVSARDLRGLAGGRLRGHGPVTDPAYVRVDFTAGGRRRRTSRRTCA